jgi:thiamine biosynthesis lipoprotein
MMERGAHGVVVSALLLLIACASPARRFEYRQRHMGTEARIVLYAPDSTAAAAAAAAAYTRVAEIERELSDYLRDGVVARIAMAGAGRAVPAPADLLQVLARARTLAAVTEGAFDPTAGAAVRLWRESRERGTLPDPASVRAALARTGWRNVAIDVSARTVVPGVAGLWLDLGGIGKGFAADAAVAVLRAHGIEHVLVEFGGEIVAGLPPPGEPGWRIRIGASGDTVRLASGAISTSGPAEQFVEVDGVRYSHVLDPRTGGALTTGRSATVRAPVGWMADMLATAATVVDAAGLQRLRGTYPQAVISVR